MIKKRKNNTLIGYIERKREKERERIILFLEC